MNKDIYGALTSKKGEEWLKLEIILFCCLLYFASVWQIIVGILSQRIDEYGIDAAIFGVFGLALHLSKSRIIATIFFIYALLSYLPAQELGDSPGNIWGYETFRFFLLFLAGYIVRAVFTYQKLQKSPPASDREPGWIPLDKSSGITSSFDEAQHIANLPKTPEVARDLDKSEE